MLEKIVVALGGHALLRPGQLGTIGEQSRNLRESIGGVVDLIRIGHPLVITHGNGPQVGHILRRSELARSECYELPLDMCVAHSQAEIGYLLQQALSSFEVDRPVAVLLTRTIVDTNDPRLRVPTKPIGPRGRLVPSPVPCRIIEAGIIRKLFEEGVVVIAVGGGGIPVRESREGLSGIEAVVDKDLASAALAVAIGAETIYDLTSIDSVRLDFGAPQERPVREMTVDQARTYLAQGQFPPGSMGPKIEAAVHFLERGGREVRITRPELILDESRGTRIYRGGSA